MHKKKPSKDSDGICLAGYSSIDVTGSCYYIYFNGKKILLECGLHQEPDYLKSYKANSKKFSFNASQIDYIFITHPHIDHIGLLPRLYKEGCKARIIISHQSATIADALLHNCAFILGEEARILSKRCKRDYAPIYGINDVETVLDFFYEYDDYGKTFVLDDTVSFEWIKNSHCIGATQLYLTLSSEHKCRHIMYTGDIGSFKTKNHFVEDSEMCQKFADVVLMESTYGDNKRTSHKTREFDVEHMRVAINTVFERGGSVIMPAFSFARTQELLTTLYELYHDDKNFKHKIVVDSMLSCQISELYSLILNKADLKLWRKVHDWENVVFVKDKEDSQMYVKDHTPKIVISSSGFCTNGRVLSYLQEYLRDINSMIIFSGFIGDTPDYLSYRIKNGKTSKTININKKPVPNKADCITMSTYSSHANHDELVAYGSNLNTNLLVLVHGSKESKEMLCKDLEESISKNDKSYRVRISEIDMTIPL